MKIEPAVKLYRILGRPALERATFSGLISAKDHGALIQMAAASGFGRIEIFANGTEITAADVPDDDVEVEITYRIAADSSSRFYDSVRSLASSPTINKGKMPPEYYIVDDDYFCGDSSSPPQSLKNLRELCTLIATLLTLANYHDTKTSEKIVFLAPSEKKTAQVVIDTNITDAILNSIDGNLNVHVLSDLLIEDSGADPHLAAKTGVFRSSLSEFMEKRPDGSVTFEHLVKNWISFTETYQHNLETYMSGFAFHKAKREVAQAEIQIAEQLSKIMGEISGKMLSIPLSFAAVIGIAEVEPTSRALIGGGLMITALIISGVVHNQQLQLKRIGHAKEVVLGGIEGRKDTYPDDLKKSIKNVRSGLDRSEMSLRRTLWAFHIFAWAPVAIAVLLTFNDWGPPTADFLQNLRTPPSITGAAQ